MDFICASVPSRDATTFSNQHTHNWRARNATRRDTFVRRPLNGILEQSERGNGRMEVVRTSNAIAREIIHLVIYWAIIHMRNNEMSSHK